MDNKAHNRTPAASARADLPAPLYKIVAALEPTAADGALLSLEGGAP